MDGNIPYMVCFDGETALKRSQVPKRGERELLRCYQTLLGAMRSPDGRWMERPAMGL